MTAEERQLWKRKVLQRWSKIVQERGGDLDAEGGEVLARLSNVTVRFGDRLVLSPQSWAVRRGQRLGVLGESGCGKSLQLRLLAGEAVPTGGSVVVEAGTRVELVDQDAPSRLHASQASLEEYAASRLGRKPTDQPCATPTGGVGSAERGDGAERAQWQLLMQTLPEELRTPQALGSKLCTFSHGQLVRVAASVAIARQPDLLLLDEPSNHLDLDGLERSVLASMGSGGVVLVSHDRELLDRISTHLLHSSGGHGELYAGSYSDFLRRSAVQAEALAQLGRDTQRDDSGWAARGLLPPPLPDRHRPSRFQLLTGKAAVAKAKRRGSAGKGAAGREMGGLAENSHPAPMLALRDVRVDFGARTAGGPADPAAAPSAARGHSSSPDSLGAPHETGAGGGAAVAEPVAGLTAVCLTVERGEVVLLVGDNGAGKSTLLNAATGRYPIAAGQVRLGDEAQLHFLPQDAAHALRGEQTAWEWMEMEAGGTSDEARRRTMRKMGIPSEAQAEPLSALSGGERTRLCIARMLLSRANLLVLDEPTNHLDLLASEYLEEAIRGFDGAVLVVSHDRHFAAQVSTRVVELAGGQLREAGGDYRSYVRARSELQERLRAREIEGDERAVTAPSSPVGKREARRRRARLTAAP